MKVITSSSLDSLKFKTLSSPLIEASLWPRRPLLSMCGCLRTPSPCITSSEGVNQRLYCGARLVLYCPAVYPYAWFSGMGKWWETLSCVPVWKEGWWGQRGGGGGGEMWIDAAPSSSPWRLALTICHPAGSLFFLLSPEWVRYTFTSSNSTFAYGSRWGTGRSCKVNEENVESLQDSLSASENCHHLLTS